MTTRFDDRSPGGLVSRRDFVALCSTLAAAFSSCSSLETRTRIASAFLADPPLGEYVPILRALVHVVLPMERGDFPLSEQQILNRLLSMFPIDEERRFLGLQKTLVFFDQVDLFPHTSGPLLAQERIALDIPVRLSEAQFRTVASEKIARETIAASQFNQGPSRFVELSLDSKRAYYRLWSQSEFTIKREFANSVRSLIFVAAYSDDRTWTAIGYEGTLIGRPEYQRSGDAKR